ncbi:MAG: EFR1 family ferrodoxin, partial [Ruminococcus sp.]
VINSIVSGYYKIPKKCKTKRDTYLKNKSNWHLIGEDFSTTQNCIKCGKCVSICPVNNISLQNEKIVFSNKCVACLGCYHRCPLKAIIYKGKNKKDRYINSNVIESNIGRDL